MELCAVGCMFLIFPAVGWSIGASRGTPLAGALISVFLGPIGWFITYISSDTRRAPCPHCAERIMKVAKVCPHCQRAL